VRTHAEVEQVSGEPEGPLPVQVGAFHVQRLNPRAVQEGGTPLLRGGKSEEPEVQEVEAVRRAEEIRVKSGNRRSATLGVRLDPDFLRGRMSRRGNVSVQGGRESEGR
jgi:hypothetical protein